MTQCDKSSSKIPSDLFFAHDQPDALKVNPYMRWIHHIALIVGN